MKYQIQENCLTIYLPKEMDHHTVNEMHKNLDTIIHKNHIKILIFDFLNTEFMDSSGIGVIMGRYRTVHLMGGEVWVIHANERMKKILNLSGMSKILHIYEEEIK